MVKSKKLLSLFLAVVMVLSVFTVMASAYTRGEAEGTADVDVKYTVEKVDVLPETAAGSAELAGDNFYAVTVWMKSAKPIDTLTVPFHYNKTLFAPITLSDGEVTYPYGVGFDQDTYYTEMGEGANYLYSLGDYMNNTGMYKANGTTATTKALAKCIGLGNPNSAGIDVRTELVSPDHPLYNSQWGVDLPADAGVVYASISVATNAKTAYFNTLEGIETYTDWVNMFTVYFEAIAEDVNGAEFGTFMDTDEVIVDACYDANGKGYYESASAYKGTRAQVNVVSNAVVEETSTPFPTETIVNPLKGQIRFHKNADGTYANGFDVRALAVISGTDFNATFDSVEKAEDMIVEAGFVFAAGSNVANPTFDAVKGLVEDGTAADGYTKKTVDFISKSTQPGDYVFSCIVTGVTDADKANSLVAVGYLAVDTDADGAADDYYYYKGVQTISYTELFNANYDKAF